MGICNANSCCKDYEVIRTNENINFQNITNNSININNNSKEKFLLFNEKSVNKGQFHLNKKYFQLLNDVRKNPSNYINESKSHNLLEIFIKLKPSKPLKLSENNILNIISYLEDSEEKLLSYIEKENEIQSMINNGNINNLCLFQTKAINNDINDNFWNFLEENEDDIDKILTVNYEYVMIICLSTETDKLNIYFIFYNEIN